MGNFPIVKGDTAPGWDRKGVEEAQLSASRESGGKRKAGWDRRYPRQFLQEFLAGATSQQVLVVLNECRHQLQGLPLHA